MKNILLIFLLMALSANVMCQSWVWGRQGFTPVAEGMKITTDRWNNVYETGLFNDSLSFGSIKLPGYNNYAGAYLVKYDVNGNVKWARQTFNGSAWGFGVAADKVGNVYEAGIFSDTITIGAFTLIAPNTLTEYFLAKYDSNGNALWVQQSQLNGTTGWPVGSVACDTNNGVYLAGTYNGSIRFQGHLLTADSASSSAFLVKYNSNGNVIWFKQPDSHSNFSTASAVCTDHSGNVLITGLFYRRVDFGPYPIYSTAKDAFIAKYDSGGRLVWVRSSFNGYAHGNDIATDNKDNILLTGSYQYGQILFGSVSLNCPPSSPYTYIFLAKYDKSGNPLWGATATQLDNNSWSGNAVSTDTLGNAYMAAGAGYSNNRRFSLTFGQDTLTVTNATDAAILVKFDSTGNYTCGSILKSGGDDNMGIAADPSGSYAFIGGDIINIGIDTIVLGNDTLSPAAGNEFPYVARWKSCCRFQVFPPDTVICAGNNITLSASGGTGYAWSNGATANTINVNPAITTTYNVVISNLICKDTLHKTVIVNPYPIVNACCDSTIYPGQSINLTTTGGGNYVWTPDEGLSCNTCADPDASPKNTTLYIVTVTGAGGCRTTDTVLVKVGECNFFVPDAFSPNNDGQNDVLYVRGKCIQDMRFVIFDRWGNKVFESEDINQGWDGNHNGQPMNTGTYVYYLRVTMNDGSVVEKKGNVALVR